MCSAAVESGRRSSPWSSLHTHRRPRHTHCTHSMALPRVLPLVSRALPRPPHLSPRRSASKSCEPTEPPPCPPCEPQPRPPCRQIPTTRVKALRVTCCPPPRGMRPPCEPAIPSCVRDCSHVKVKVCEEKHKVISASTMKECSISADRASARLAAARAERCRRYLEEVAGRRPAGRPCGPFYRLAVARECIPAADGQMLTLCESGGARGRCRRAPEAPPCVPAKATRACGPCREPPPPEMLEVEDNACKIRCGPCDLDPCAHIPKKIVTIDRSKNKDGAGGRTRENYPRPQAAAGFTSKIMKSLNMCRGAGEAGAGAKNDKGFGACKCGIEAKKDKGFGACKPAGGAKNDKGFGVCKSGAGTKTDKSAGCAPATGGVDDKSWCETFKPAPSPPNCRPPSQMDQIKQRICRDIDCRSACDTKPGARSFHTAVAARTKEAPVDMKAMAAKVQKNVEKLEKMLHGRTQLKEAARGRSVGCGGKRAAALPVSGGLQLRVPPDAGAVQVSVTLSSATAAPDAPAAPSPAAAPRPCLPRPCPARPAPPQSPCAARAAVASCASPSVDKMTNTASKDSWLSICKRN